MFYINLLLSLSGIFLKKLEKDTKNNIHKSQSPARFICFIFILQRFINLLVYTAPNERLITTLNFTGCGGKPLLPVFWVPNKTWTGPHSNPGPPNYCMYCPNRSGYLLNTSRELSLVKYGLCLTDWICDHYDQQ